MGAGRRSAVRAGRAAGVPLLLAGAARPRARCLLLPAAAARARAVPVRRRAHQRRRRHVLRLRALAAEGRRPRLHQRVRALRAASSASDLRGAHEDRAAPLDLLGRARRWSGSPFFLLGEAVGRARRAGRARRVDLSGYGPVHVQRGGARQLALRLRGRAARSTTCCAATSRAGVALGARAARCGGPPSCTGTWSSSRRCPTRPPPSAAALVALAVGPRRAATARRAGYLLLGLVARPRHVHALAERRAAAPARPSTCCAACARRRAPRGGARRRGVRSPSGALVGALPQMRPGTRSTAMWLLPTRRTAPTSCASTIPSSWRRSSRRATACSPGRRCSGPASSASCRCCATPAARWPLPLLLPLVLMTYVNMCSGDWWAGGSFSNRRFDSLLPVLALGLAASSRARAALARRPAARPRRSWRCRSSLWNAALVGAGRARGAVPRDDTRRLPRARGRRGARWSRTAVGSPPTWPASWLFAWRARPAARPVRSAGGPLPLLSPEQPGGPRRARRAGDEALLGEGWGAARRPRTACAARPLARAGAPVRARSTCPRTSTIAVRAAAAGRATRARRA